MTSESARKMSLVERALALALNAHAGVVDKQGNPYILHPIRVMLGVRGEVAQAVGMLHDVVEDTEITLDEIRSQGFPEEVIAALALVTHRPDQSYAEYVVGCATNEAAKQVKLSDLRDNSALERMLMRPEKLDRDTTRVQRYGLSYRFLIGELSEADYRQAMARIES